MCGIAHSGRSDREEWQLTPWVGGNDVFQTCQDWQQAPPTGTLRFEGPVGSDPPWLDDSQCVNFFIPNHENDWCGYLQRR